MCRQQKHSAALAAQQSPQMKTDKTDANETNKIVSDYFRSSINSKTDKKASWVLINKIHYEFSEVLLQEYAVLKVHLVFKDKGWQPAITHATQKGSICCTRTPERGVREITKATNDCGQGVDETTEC